MSMYELLREGGLALLPVVLVSVVSWALILERVLISRRIRREFEDVVPKLRSMARRGDGTAINRYCNQRRSEVTSLLRAGIERWGEGRDRIRDAIGRAGRVEELRLTRSADVPMILAVTAPMVGFLGSVAMVAGIAPFPSGSLGAVPLSTLLPAAVGCVLGIPAWVCAASLNSAARLLVFDMEQVCCDFLFSLLPDMRGVDASGGRGKQAEPVGVHEDGDEYFRKKR